MGIEGKDDIVINPSAFIYSIELAFNVDGTASPIVGKYSSNNEMTKAYKAGLREGDIITKIEAGNKILATDVTKQSIINFFNSKELEEGQKVILVDHNEMEQSINGAAQAEIVEIVDHHRIGGIKTTSPVMFRNELVGCCCTIIAKLYGEKNVEMLPMKDLLPLTGYVHGGCYRHRLQRRRQSGDFRQQPACKHHCRMVRYNSL